MSEKEQNQIDLKCLKCGIALGEYQNQQLSNLNSPGNQNALRENTNNLEDSKDTNTSK